MAVGAARDDGSCRRGHFVDVADDEVLAQLHRHPGVERALKDPVVRQAFGPDVRLDLGTICSVGPAGRMITQAVSQAIYILPSRPTGIAYVTRFDHSERCWAVFDERAILDFTVPKPLDSLDPAQRADMQGVADQYGLVLPPTWR